MTHSPGPWRYVIEDGERYIRDDDNDSLQCDTNYYPWVSHNEADWHLIAAAPELLSTNKRALAALEILKDVAQSVGVLAHLPCLPGIMVEMQAAIAKAEGRA
jgi:hypothetical protein